MRVAIYNQMYALNGKSFFSSIIGHWAVHFQNSQEKIWKRADIDRTVKIIKKSNADIIGICEIIKGQEKELAGKLKKLGYKWIFFGEGHKTKFRHLQIKVAIASKILCKKEYIHKEVIENKIGGGGGFVDCYFPSLKLNVLNVHLGLRKSLRKKQLGFLKSHLKKREKFILMGDFNSSFNKIYPYFKDLNLLSGKIKTCSLTPFLHTFSWKDSDHILARRINKKRIGFLEGYSDHRLVYVDLN